MIENNFGDYHIRKWYTFTQEVLANETRQLADGEPLHKFVIAAVAHNPYAGTFSEDLSKIVDGSDKLGEEFGRRAVAAAGDKQICSYGKAIIVGVNGEYEHGNAFLTNVFADPVRKALGGAPAWMPSTGKRGGPGATIDVPLAHKDEVYVRSHYDTISVMVDDGPDPDEVVILLSFATRGRLHARLGGLRAEDVVGSDGLK